MPSRQVDRVMKGSAARRKSVSALLIIDMINSFDYPGGRVLARNAGTAARRARELRDGCVRRGMPVIYCNDNFGQWRSDFRGIYERCARPDARGAAIATLLAPLPDDYFVLKPRHSAFYQTPLHLLLQSLGARRLILAGIAGDGCVLMTANDAHIREYEVAVASDATVSQRPASNRRALNHLAEVVGVAVRPVAALVRGGRKRRFRKQARG
jgi:nicotinamidase-related amidase